MCARFTQFGIRQIQENFGLTAPLPDLTPLYNIAPNAAVPVVVRTAEQGRHLRLMRWGLVPPWQDDHTTGVRMINARSETVAEKPSFRTAYKRRRCLVPTDGFFEWTGEKGDKQPWFIRSRKYAAFAGIWEIWERAEGYLETFSILTTAANGVVGQLHDRMPVWIFERDFGAWLGPGEANPALLAPAPDELTECWPVTRAMGNPRFKDPSAVVPIEIPGTLF